MKKIKLEVILISLTVIVPSAARPERLENKIEPKMKNENILLDRTFSFYCCALRWD